MLIALNTKDQRISADKANKLDGYRCPFCKKSLVLKSGSVKIHHFAQEGFPSKFAILMTLKRIITDLQLSNKGF